MFFLKVINKAQVFKQMFYPSLDHEIRAVRDDCMTTIMIAWQNLTVI